MLTVQIQQERIIKVLQQFAKANSTTINEVTEDALLLYLQIPPYPVKRYSFIGIGHSGKGNLSIEAEEILAEAIDRREGWSFPE